MEPAYNSSSTAEYWRSARKEEILDSLEGVFESYERNNDLNPRILDQNMIEVMKVGCSKFAQSVEQGGFNRHQEENKKNLNVTAKVVTGLAFTAITYGSTRNLLEGKNQNVEVEIEGNGVPKLTDDEMWAVNSYISSDSYIINEKLRNGMPLNEREQKIVNSLDKALEKFPKFEGNLTRSLQFLDQDLADQFFNSFEINKTKSFQEFISTTKGNVYNPDGQVQIYIESTKKGFDISMINTKEQEVLYQRNTTFKVLNKVKQDGVYYILLKEN